MLGIVEKEERASPWLAMVLLCLSYTSIKRWQIKSKLGHTVFRPARAEQGLTKGESKDRACTHKRSCGWRPQGLVCSGENPT